MVDEIKWLLETLAKYSLSGLVAGGIMYLLIKNHVSSYLTEKGKNIATKEDIADITDKVKGVEHQYNVLVHELQSKQQLRMAALDKRLQAHQEAFTLWRELYASEDGKEGPIILRSQAWWERNCVYLEPKVREAFALAYHSYSQRQALIAARAPAAQITEVWKHVTAFPNILFEAVKLPGLTQAEAQAVMPRSEESGER